MQGIRVPGIQNSNNCAKNERFFRRFLGQDGLRSIVMQKQKMAEEVVPLRYRGVRPRLRFRDARLRQKEA